MIDKIKDRVMIGRNTVYCVFDADSDGAMQIFFQTNLLSDQRSSSNAAAFFYKVSSLLTSFIEASSCCNMPGPAGLSSVCAAAFSIKGEVRGYLSTQTTHTHTRIHTNTACALSLELHCVMSAS